MTGMKAETVYWEKGCTRGAENTQTKGLNWCETETERERKKAECVRVFVSVDTPSVWQFVLLWTHCFCCSQPEQVCCLSLFLSLSQYTCLYLYMSVSIILPLPLNSLLFLYVHLALSCCCVWLPRPQVKPGTRVDGCPVTGSSMPAVRRQSSWRRVWREHRSAWRGRDSKHRT